MTEYADILFIGDIVGSPGRKAVKKYLKKIKDGLIEFPEYFKKEPDFTIANAENASHGFGLTERNYNQLLEYGIDVLTSGNHIWDRKEIFNYIEIAEKLIRPINYPSEVPGVGSRIFKINDKISLGVINILGRVFMGPIDSYWDTVKEIIQKIQYETPIIVIDFHGEATAEKISFAHYVNELGVSAVFGTHTHVQTADEKILSNGTAYISDAGYCGAYNSVIGMDIGNSLKRLKTNLPERFDVASDKNTEVNAVRVLINAKTGCAEKIFRCRYLTEISEDN